MISLGTLKSFNSTDYRAEVQMAGSITAYLDNIPVARNIASSQMVTGRHVILAIPGNNPKDACVIAVWAAAAGGGGGGGGITDHGELAGLEDDDHSQYLNIARHDLTTRHPLGTVVPHEPNLNNIGDVSVPTPADEDVIYWDNAESKWKCKQPGGGGASTFLSLTDTPGSYSGQAGKYPKVNAAQNALEFGQTLDDHHARHEWLGDDPIKGNFVLLPMNRYISNDWRTMDSWTTYHTGSGSCVWTSLVQYNIKTGSTNGSRAAIYSGVGAGISPQMANRPIMFAVQFAYGSTANSEVRLYALQTGEAYPPSDTSKHIGFKIINGDVYATNADGSTERATNLGVHWDQYQGASMFIVGDGSSIKYYLGADLKATHTDRIPSNYNYRIWCGIKNTAASDKDIRINHINIFTC